MAQLPAHYNFLEELIADGLPHLAVMGTMHEVGYWEGEITEHTPCNPQSLYGIAKNALRQAVLCNIKDKPIIFQWLRAYYIYGDDSRSKSIFYKIAQAEAEGNKIFPFTSGLNKYDFIDVGELSRQIAATVCQKEINGIINCCSGKPEALKDAVENYICRNNFKIKLAYGHYPERPYDSPAVWGNSSKIENILNEIL
jgi:dTDP-6-deoxy-L-talose 4-dehydrogenase (NAD+)